MNFKIHLLMRIINLVLLFEIIQFIINVNLKINFLPLIFIFPFHNVIKFKFLANLHEIIIKLLLLII